MATRTYGSSQEFKGVAGEDPTGTTRAIALDAAGAIITSGSSGVAGSSAASNVPAPQSASLTVVKSSGGMLLAVVVTTPGAAAVPVYDNASAASGVEIGYIPANAPAGSIFAFNMPAANGITIPGGTANPSLTFSVTNSTASVAPGSTTSLSYPVAVPVQAGDFVARAYPGKVLTAVVTAVGAAATLIYDNASAGSGTQIAAIPANAPVGSIFTINMPCANGITVKGNASNSGLTLGVMGATIPAPVAVPVQAGAYVVQSRPGTLHRGVVTAVGTAAMTFYDNASAASGTPIGIIPANSPVGTVFAWEMPAQNGITASGSASNPAVTVASE